MAREYQFSTVQQYLNIVRLIHLELGLSNPLKDNWLLSTTLSGIKRDKSSSSSYKLPIDIDTLVGLYDKLAHHNSQHCCIWAAILCCFFGLLRVSNVTVKHSNDWDPAKVIKRSDFSACNKGCVLTLSWSKTIQCKERCLQVPLPYISNSVLCPTTALLKLLSMTSSIPSHMPLISHVQGASCVPLTEYTFRKFFKQLLPDKNYGTHSLRRGGATWLLVSGVPLDMVKVLGDWKSDAVQRYIKPSTHDKFDSLSLAIDNIKHRNTSNVNQST